MLWNLSGEPTRDDISVNATGDTVIIPAITDGEIFIHELIGGADGTVTLTVKCGSRTVRTFNLAAGESITENDIAGKDGEPVFKCYNNEAFTLNFSATVPFTGGVTYSYKR